jgi:hypothetical protein
VPFFLSILYRSEHSRLFSGILKNGLLNTHISLLSKNHADRYLLEGKKCRDEGEIGKGRSVGTRGR